jgi:hypothetical protein
VSPDDEALMVYAAPDLSRVRSENVATPVAAFCVVVPPSVAPPGLFPIAIVIGAVEEVTGFPLASCTLTLTAGVIAAPTAVLLGWAVKPSFVGMGLGPGPPPSPPHPATSRPIRRSMDAAAGLPSNVHIWKSFAVIQEMFREDSHIPLGDVR